MPTKTKTRAAAPRLRRAAVQRKTKAGARRQAGRKPPAVSARPPAGSPFAVKFAPKGYGAVDQNVHGREEKLFDWLSHDLVKCYNHAAKLLRKKPIASHGINAVDGVVQVLELFKANLCPEGFEVNIDEHHDIRRKKAGHHFTVYKECDFDPSYWHFFEVKHLLLDLAGNNPMLHDLFTEFLASFIHYCRVPVWWGMEMSDAYFILDNYLHELKGCMHAGVPQETYDRTGYTEADMKKREADITATMKDYSEGQAHHYSSLLKSLRPKTPAYLMECLNCFPPQLKLVQFMKHACLLMQCGSGVYDYCYLGAENDSNDGELSFNQMVTIIWDWNDHLSKTYSNDLEAIANGVGATQPTVCARFTPIGCGKLNWQAFTSNTRFPVMIEKLQAMFQPIAERYTNYDKPKVLI